MKIETLDEWNSVLTGCGCCPMPVCPVPERECESITVPNCGHALPSHPNAPADCTKYSTKTTTYELSGSTDLENVTETRLANQTSTTVIDLVRDEAGDPKCRTRYGQASSSTTTTETTEPDSLIVIFDSGDSPLGTWIPDGNTLLITANISWNYSYTYPPDPPDVTSGTGIGPVAWNDAHPDAAWAFTSPATFTRTYVNDYGPAGSDTITETVVYSGAPPDPFEVFVFPDDINGEICGASRNCDTVTKTRFRWVVPESWAGSYFKISWNILTEPDGWDDEEAETPPERTLSEDQTWVWSGPGNPEDEDSWKSGWYDIPPPDVPGQRRVVNLRFECYKSTGFGVKPQVTGEAVELPDP